MGVFLDFCKVFDTVDHEVLLQKIQRLGVHGNVYALLASYLADRKQFLIVNSDNSNLQLGKRFVPQGLNSDRFSFLCT